MSAIVEIAGVTKRYGDVTAVEDVTLQLEPGEVVALVGHNGAGKTTLMKLVLGLIAPTRGSIRVFGVDPATAAGAAARRALGFLPENVAFHGAMTGRELMDFYARLKGAPRGRNAELLARVGLESVAGRRVATYSKGMRQRLGLAQALIGPPKLMLLDEPTSGLDPASRADVYEMIRSLRGEGTTLLVSTHALREMEGRADRIAIMHESRLISLGPLSEIRRRAAPETMVIMRVRPCSTSEILRRLPEECRCAVRSEDSLTVAIAPAEKMALLRAAASMPELVLDLEIVRPDLEDVYRKLVAASVGGGS
jgi:Cu-processing system ATP-binding protein